MDMNRVDSMISKAHKIFGETSIYEVIDLENRQAAIDFLNRAYGNPDKKLVEEYLEIAEALKTM